MKFFASIVFQCLLILAVATTLAWALNSLRSQPIPWVAPFPYESECADKTPLSALSGTKISLAHLQQRQATKMRIALLDARPAELHQEHHLDSARSLPYSIFNPVGKKGAQQLEGYALVVVYCDSPHDALARRLAGQLRSLGVSQVKVLENGAKALEKKAPPK